MNTSYPRVYRYGPLSKVMWSLVALLMAAGGLAAGHVWRIGFGMWFNAVITAAGAGLASWCSSRIRSPIPVLWPDEP